MRSEMFSAARITMVLAALLLGAGCATLPHLGTEDSGRRAIVWGNDTAASKTPDTHVTQGTERELLAKVHAAEQQGTDTLAVASTLYDLAILRRQQGADAEAGRLYRRALEIREREEGPNHPDVAKVLNNLGVLEAGQGNYAAAQPLLERALSIRQTTLGYQHALTAESLNNLALLYAAQGNVAAAEPLYRGALAILEKSDERQKAGPPNGDSRVSQFERVLDNYAALLRDTGRDSAAERIEARALAIRATRGQTPDASR